MDLEFEKPKGCYNKKYLQYKICLTFKLVEVNMQNRVSHMSKIFRLRSCLKPKITKLLEDKDSKIRKFDLISRYQDLVFNFVLK